MVHTAAGDRWRRTLRQPDGSLPPRSRDLAVERAFWHRHTSAGDTPLDNYANTVFHCLCGCIAPYAIHSVLEIGPGWGNYTLPLCRRFGRITCVDVSPDNLMALSRRTGGAITPVCAPWEKAEAARHDLIFGYNCLYRLEEPEHFLLKMDALADQLCVLGMNRPPELPWLSALAEEGIALHYTRQGCEELLEVLDSLHIPTRLVEIPNTRLYRAPDREAVLARAEGFLLEQVPRERLWAILRPFYREEADSSLVCEYPFTSQLLVWEPRVFRSAAGGVGNRRYIRRDEP